MREGCQRISIILIFQLFGDILETVDFTGFARDYIVLYGLFMRLSGILFIIVGRYCFEGMPIGLRCTATLIIHIFPFKISTFSTVSRKKSERFEYYTDKKQLKIARKNNKLS